MEFKRVFGIVIDSVGIGTASDAAKFDDVSSDTLGSIGSYFKDKLELPNLINLGLGNIRSDNPIEGIDVVKNPLAYFGKMHEVSAGKDSMDGHFEMMGLPVMEKLGFFPNGFPKELLEKIEKFSGRKIIVNKPYSGTKVIEDYGEEQLKTGALIVYTSGDSVLQIAASEDLIPLEELYRICEYTRKITIDKYHIGRIIARPYVGKTKDTFKRTSNRHDYALKPKSKTDLDYLKDAGFDVIAVGKTNDIFSGQGITKGFHTKSNHDGMEKTIALTEKDFTGFVFTNLVDFDAMYGHRRDILGYGEALMEFDKQLGILLSKIRKDDLVIIVADHGNDPGFKGTDHTREYVPLIVYSKKFKNSASLGIRQTYADMGATITENFGVRNTGIGQSFLKQLK